MNRRVFSCCLSFPKVSAKNIYDCGQKPGEADIAQMVSKTKNHMPLIKLFCEVQLIDYRHLTPLCHQRKQN